MHTTYLIPFVTSDNQLIYWNRYNDLSGGYFCTSQEVLPLAALVSPKEVHNVCQYLAHHKLSTEGMTVKISDDQRAFLKSLAVPVITEISKPMINW